MKINVVPSPGTPAPQAQQSNPAQDARARAIAAHAGGSPNNSQAAVPNQSSIGVEELRAAKSSIIEEKQNSNQTEQSDNTEEATPPTKEEPISTQYAVLARKEKQLRAKAVQQETTFKQREAALAAREAELNAKSTQDLSNYISKDQLKRNAYGVLTENGIDYDQITQQAMSAQSPEAQMIREMKTELERELKKVREEQDNTRKSYEEQNAKQYQQALTQIRNEVTHLVKNDAAFETIKETGSIGDVVDLIERTFKEDGTLLTAQQAAELFEEHLVEEAMKISKIKKIQERLKSSGAKPPVPQQSANTPANQQSTPGTPMKTLTNAVGSNRPLSARERALLAFKNELK